MGQNLNIQVNDKDAPQTRSHLFRYFNGRGYVEPTDIVVDAGCGYGYGTELIARVAKKAIGIDRDVEAIKYAMEHYKRDNSYYIVGNFDQMESFPQCDVIICCEVLEHLRYPESFAYKIKQSTRRMIFLTTPIVPTMKDDPTHLHDFTANEIVKMFKDDKWGMIDYSVQGPYLLISFYKK